MGSARSGLGTEAPLEGRRDIEWEIRDEDRRRRRFVGLVGDGLSDMVVCRVM